MPQSVMSEFQVRFKRLAPIFVLTAIAMHVYIWSEQPDFVSFMHYAAPNQLLICLCHCLLACVVRAEASNRTDSEDDSPEELVEIWSGVSAEETSGSFDDGAETGDPEFNIANGLLMVDSYFDINGNPFGTTFNDD